MSSPETTTKKKKKPSPTPQSTTDSSLPDDLLLSIVARVSRLYYPTLSRVSKSFRSLLVSQELYRARSLLGHTESCLYVCLELQRELYPSKNPSWFTLWRKPHQTLTNETSKKKKSRGYVLVSVPVLHSPPACPESLVAVGSNIYNIGTLRENMVKSSNLSILDCRSHTWREAPSLRVKLFSFRASVLDRKIYVAGSYKDVDSNSYKNSTEVFDTETQIWDPEPISYSNIKGLFYFKSACIDKKIFLKTDNEVVSYNPKEGRWSLVQVGMSYFEGSDSSCEIENVLYTAYGGTIRWYDTKVDTWTWRKLKGLVGIPKFEGIRLAGYGGKMMVLWDQSFPYRHRLCGYKTMIWCAEIALEKRKNNEIWGTVEWSGHVLTVPCTYRFVKVLAATV
ncbi:F-box domain [Arabidopsis suecica]|uniref:F-box domain n=1 Tax=Arabidopsis suecica TaxID=45249 RepID=A0A8T2C1G7_ARASU|nr:F-box domain [Arabidopsis suecica]